MIGDPRLPARFWANVQPDESGCWIWTGPRRENGYGCVWADGSKTSSHTRTYEALISLVPSGLELDHLCRVRACCNPAHLEPVTHEENMRRGSDARTECRNGHPYDAANQRRRSNGRRLCQTCRVSRRQRYRANRKVQAS